MNNRPLIAFLIIGIILSSGCATTLAELNAKLKSKSNELSGTATAQQQTTQQPTAQGATVKLGAWNVQNFGYTKAGKPEIMAVIRSTISGYDMLALQEIQDVSGTTSMVAISESLPSGYRLIATQPIGRTTHQERYVIVYDPSDFNYIESYTYNDTQDVFEREPLVARFSRNGVDFSVIVCHVKPGDAFREIRELERVATEVVSKYNDYDVIVTGDMNSDCQYFSSPLFTNYYPLINYGEDTTVGSTYCAYDRIFISHTLKPYISDYGIDRNPLITLEVSDHFPVFFYMN